MTDERPLNVQVAEALGWTHLIPYDAGGWWGISPLVGEPRDVPPYGEDSPEGWAFTGPLQHRFRIGVRPYENCGGGISWAAETMDGADPGDSHKGPRLSIPESVAWLIVALAKEGRLS